MLRFLNVAGLITIDPSEEGPSEEVELEWEVEWNEGMSYANIREERTFLPKEHQFQKTLKWNKPGMLEKILHLLTVI